VAGAPTGEVNQLRRNYAMAMIPGEARGFGRCDLEIADRRMTRGRISGGTSPGPGSTCMPPILVAASCPRKTGNSLRRETRKIRLMTGSASGRAALSGFRATGIHLCM
jgi:hypothetical protein